MSTAQSLHPRVLIPFKRIRIVTATSLFDGHDSSINIMRRILQDQGCEVIHLGHDRGVNELVSAVVQEDVHAIAISSYQGGHMEFFRYLVDQLRERGREDVLVYGGGGGTILPEEINSLMKYGVRKIFSPEEGRRLGLEGMIETIVQDCNRREFYLSTKRKPLLDCSDHGSVGRVITWLENSPVAASTYEEPEIIALDSQSNHQSSVIGLTGTGGSGKSSIVDELVRRFIRDNPELTVGLLLVDPSRRRTGGALLGDRLRLGCLSHPRVFARSLATRRDSSSVAACLGAAIHALKQAKFDLIIVETAGIGQSDSEVIHLVDLSVYVMTPDFGAPSQLEKIDMLDLAHLVILNKFDRQGGEDALREVRTVWERNHRSALKPDSTPPVFPTCASVWNDQATEVAYQAVRKKLLDRHVRWAQAPTPLVANEVAPSISLPTGQYLAEMASCVRNYHQHTTRVSNQASDAYALSRVLSEVGAPLPAPCSPLTKRAASSDLGVLLSPRYHQALKDMDDLSRCSLEAWPSLQEKYAQKSQTYRAREKKIMIENYIETLSDSHIKKVSLPHTKDWGEILQFLRSENLPGHFPFTAGVFPFKRTEEDPVRMFAGEGTPERTNHRFHLLSKGQRAPRLSTAFDSVTLYGRDPSEERDTWGKIGNAGVSVCTLDDSKKLFSGFNLADPKTSVSMTINGPAPTILAFFLNTAVDQQVEAYLIKNGELDRVRAEYDDLPSYAGPLPEGHNGLGLGLLGINGIDAVPPAIYKKIYTETLQRVRGTVQADILKEEQAQNTCIFSINFALKMMGDVQAYFIEQEIHNFYSVSISGYHMAEAGANPITQLAFTLANGFTYCEHYLQRGMHIDDFAPNFSFFFSNGLDIEYNVIGRVARRIWAIVMRERFGASERSQKLKYHIQTSGRSLHAQEMGFNDIRTTLQALTALQDGCNSLHTNAYDEAVTTPSEESVRRAMAIQLIVGREYGLSKSQNAIQGSFAIEELTYRVEGAVLDEFDRLSQRGGVLGAMETLYQRGKIQDESMRYESMKHSGQLPIIGVNTFENPRQDISRPSHIARSSDAEKQSQFENLEHFRRRHQGESLHALETLKSRVQKGDNVFAELMVTVRSASLGEITELLFEVGGTYRRCL